MAVLGNPLPIGRAIGGGRLPQTVGKLAFKTTKSRGSEDIEESAETREIRCYLPVDVKTARLHAIRQYVSRELPPMPEIDESSLEYRQWVEKMQEAVDNLPVDMSEYT